jgi:hypothetical protein
MKISKAALKAYAEIVNSAERKARRVLYFNMYKMLNGGAYDLIREAIRKEFKDPQAVAELEGRLVPINLLKKVTKKLGSVYLEPPVRSPVDENESDAELLEDYEDITKINIRQKQANRYLELFKKNLKEIFASDFDNMPHVRNLAPHTYEVFNVINPDKSQPDIVCKIVRDNSDPKEQVFHWYSDESFWITDGSGEVIIGEMLLLENPQGKNPAKTLPFVYKCQSTDSVDPVMDDSLYRISIAIPIVLTDLFFACKYQCWSMIYTIGVTGDINRNPSSIISLQRAEGDDNDPIIDQINPTVDSDKVIAMIEATLNLFLSSLGLSAGTISLGKNPREVISGVSKVMDSAEVIEGKQDQQDDMLDDENMTWAKIKLTVPYWRRNQMLSPDINREFSKTFKVSVSFKNPKPLLSERDALEMSEKRIKAKFSTYRRELANLYPDYGDDQIDELIQEIIDEEKEFPDLYKSMNPIQVSFNGGKNGVQSKVPNKPDEDIP